MSMPSLRSLFLIKEDVYHQHWTSNKKRYNVGMLYDYAKAALEEQKSQQEARLRAVQRALADVLFLEQLLLSLQLTGRHLQLRLCGFQLRRAARDLLLRHACINPCKLSCSQLSHSSGGDSRNLL